MKRRSVSPLSIGIFAIVVLLGVWYIAQTYTVSISRFFAAEPGLSESGFVRVQGKSLSLNGRPWFSKGANWIAVRYPMLEWLKNPRKGDTTPSQTAFLDAEWWNPAKLDAELFQLHEMLGINTIRFPGPIGLDENGDWKPGYQERVREFIRLAHKNGIRINWTLFFGVPGFNCPNEKGGTTPCDVRAKPDIGKATLMPPDSERAQKTLKQVRTFVSAFKDEPGVLSYEVGNELLLNGTVRGIGYQEQMLSYIKQILDEVRRNDKNHFTVSGEVAVIEGPNDNRWPWLEGKGVEFVKFEDIHKLNKGQPFSLYDIIDVLGSHMYQPPEKVRSTVDVIVAANSAGKPILFGEYGGGGATQGHVALADPAEQGRWHRAILAEARARLAGAWVWNPVPNVDLKPGTYRIETWQSNSGLRPILVFNGPPERRLRVLSLAHWILRYQENTLNPLAMTPASLALANRRATFVRQSVPQQMVAGQQYSVSLTWRNDGDSAWDFAGSPGNYGYAFRIKSVRPYDNMTWGLNYVPQPVASVLPGQEATYQFTVTAPKVPGTYLFQWQMNQGLVGWFGDFSKPISVRVTK